MELRAILLGFTIGVILSGLVALFAMQSDKPKDVPQVDLKYKVREDSLRILKLEIVELNFRLHDDSTMIKYFIDKSFDDQQHINKLLKRSHEKSILIDSLNPDQLYRYLSTLPLRRHE